MALLFHKEIVLLIWALFDAYKGNLEHEDVNVEEIWDQLQENIQYVKDNNMDVKKFYEMFLNSEPYCKIDEIKDRINKEMLKYE